MVGAGGGAGEGGKEGGGGEGGVDPKHLISVFGFLECGDFAVREKKFGEY